jgi:hypothetical protein
MAAKKTPKTTPIPAATDAAETPKPIAKKAVKKAAAKKAPAAPKKAALVSPTPLVAKKTTPRPSLDDLARAAYLNYRRRVEQNLPGDSRGDWLEAERQFSGQV